MTGHDIPRTAETRILDLYRQVGVQAAEWGDRVPLISDAGFRILSGPPIVGAPMIVSLNPGLTDTVREHDTDDFWPQGWPNCLGYLRGISAFARRTSQIFEKAAIDPAKVNAAYVLAFRSSSIKEWKDRVPLDVRRSAERLSLQVLTELISILQPSFIYIAGFSTLKRMGCSVERMEYGRHKSGEEFVLLRYGSFGGRPVIASPHPSGARLTNANLDQIAKGLSIQ